MREIGVRELKAPLSEVLRVASHGERVRVTVHGRAVADIVAPDAVPGDHRLRSRDRGTARRAGTSAPTPGTASRAGVAAGLGDRARRAGRRALILYLDASALVKRYVAEHGSGVVRRALLPPLTSSWRRGTGDRTQRRLRSACGCSQERCLTGTELPGI